MEDLYNRAVKLGATDFGISKTKNKRFYIIYNNKKINFGSKLGQTYIDHNDNIKKKNWRARHSKIINSEGKPFYKIKTSPEYWSWHLLWDENF